MGVRISGVGTEGRLEGCEISRTELEGIEIDNGADPLFVDCKYVFIMGAIKCCRVNLFSISRGA